MRRALYATLLLPLLGGCTAPAVYDVHKPDGETVEVAYIILAPLCLWFCNTTVSTTGSKIEGEGSNTQSTNQTVQTTGGGQ